MKAIKNSCVILSMLLFINLGMQAIDKPDFIKKFFPDKTAEYYEKKGTPFVNRSKQLKEEMSKLAKAIMAARTSDYLGHYTNVEQQIIRAAQNIVASPLLTNKEKERFALETARKIVRLQNNMQAGAPLNDAQEAHAQQISQGIYKRHGW